jgi:CubicO group peptidase (beta-lactamase class C family)
MAPPDTPRVFITRVTPEGMFVIQPQHARTPRSRWTLIACVSVGVAAVCGAQREAVLADRADALFAHYNRDDSPGLAVAVVRAGAVVFARGYGLANREQRTRIATSTVFDVGSVTKQFTGMAVAMLAEEGALTLDADIRRYLPEMNQQLPPISVRQLLHHTSGLRDFVGGLRLGGWGEHDPMTRDDVLRFATRQVTLNFPPGTEYSYSNTNYGLLAEIVSRVSGQPFAQFVADRMFRPLGMKDTGFPDSARSSAFASSYVIDPSGRLQLAVNVLNAPGPSSLRTSIDDLVRWVTNFDSGRVGGSAVFAHVRTPGRLNGGVATAYGFGVELQRYRGAHTIEHSGAWAGYTANVLYFQEHQAGVIVLSNLGSVNPIRASRALADIFFADVLGDVLPPPVPPRHDARVDPHVLDRYTGTYRLGPGWYLRVGREGRALTVQANGEPKTNALAISDTAFWVPDYKSLIAFSGDAVPVLRLRDLRGEQVLSAGLTTPAAFDQFAGRYTSDEVSASVTIAVDNRTLVLRTAHGQTTSLAHAWGDDFSGSRYPFSAVTFERDQAGQVVALSVFANERNRNVRFVKRTGGE